MESNVFAMGAVTKPQSSLFVAILNFFDYYYTNLFMVLEVLLFVYKSQTLPYPSNALGAEVAFLIFWYAVQHIRLSLGNSANKGERSGLMIVFGLLSLGCCFCMVYLMFWQVYVLRFELILCALVLIFSVLESLSGLVLGLFHFRESI